MADSLVRRQALRQAEMFHLCGWTPEEIADHLAIPLSTIRRYLNRPDVQERLAEQNARTLNTLSRAAAQRIIAARDRLIEALPAVADRLARAALAPFYIERSEELPDGTVHTTRVPNPEFPPQVIEMALRLVLDRAGLTERYAQSLTNSQPAETPPAPTPEHIDALTRLVQAAHALPSPPSEPPIDVTPSSVVVK